MPHSYPSKILPRLRYRYRLPMRKLLQDYPDLAVARRCKLSDPFVYSSSNNRKMLSNDALEENLLEMSVNLLGGCFSMKHMPYVPKWNKEDDEVNKDWNGTLLPLLSLKQIGFSIEPVWSVISFRVSDVNKFVFPYIKAIDMTNYETIKKDARRVQEREKLDIDIAVVGAFKQEGNGMTSVYSRLYVNHHPKFYNYWHMQMDVYAVGKDDYEKHDSKSKEARRIRHQLRESLTRKAISQLGKRYHICRRYYMHGTGRCSYIFDSLKNWFVNRYFKFQYVMLDSGTNGN